MDVNTRIGEDGQPESAAQSFRVLFVCLGNICRSVAAEMAFNAAVQAAGLADHVESDSCGTANYHVGQKPDARMLAALERAGFEYNGHRGRQFSRRDFVDFEQDIKTVSEKNFPVFSAEIEEKMQEKILEAAKDGDSVGGILETAVIGLPRGLGEPWFDTLEGTISHAVFSVPAVKGIEFGAGFSVAEMRGSEANDTMRMENGQVKMQSNVNGGIVGGIANGAPLIFRCAVKPTPSIFKEQKTVNFVEGKDADLTLTGRHDPCIVHRAAVVVRAVTALALADQLATRYGTDWLSGGTKK